MKDRYESHITDLEGSLNSLTEELDASKQRGDRAVREREAATHRVSQLQTQLAEARATPHAEQATTVPPGESAEVERQKVVTEVSEECVFFFI